MVSEHVLYLYQVSWGFVASQRQGSAGLDLRHGPSSGWLYQVCLFHHLQCLDLPSSEPLLPSLPPPLLSPPIHLLPLLRSISYLSSLLRSISYLSSLLRSISYLSSLLRSISYLSSLLRSISYLSSLLRSISYLSSLLRSISYLSSLLRSISYLSPLPLFRSSSPLSSLSSDPPLPSPPFPSPPLSFPLTFRSQVNSMNKSAS